LAPIPVVPQRVLTSTQLNGKQLALCYHGTERSRANASSEWSVERGRRVSQQLVASQSERLNSLAALAGSRRHCAAVTPVTGRCSVLLSACKLAGSGSGSGHGSTRRRQKMGDHDHPRRLSIQCDSGRQDKSNGTSTHTLQKCVMSLPGFGVWQEASLGAGHSARLR
jgi:hypothetical protein